MTDPSVVQKKQKKKQEDDVKKAAATLGAEVCSPSAVVLPVFTQHSGLSSPVK